LGAGGAGGRGGGRRPAVIGYRTEAEGLRSQSARSTEDRREKKWDFKMVDSTGHLKPLRCASSAKEISSRSMQSERSRMLLGVDHFESHFFSAGLRSSARTAR